MRQNQPRYVTLLLTSALGHSALCTWQALSHLCVICCKLICPCTADNTRFYSRWYHLPNIGCICWGNAWHSTESSWLLWTLLNCSMTQRIQTFREIEIYLCSYIFIEEFLEDISPFFEFWTSVDFFPGFQMPMYFTLFFVGTSGAGRFQDMTFSM